MPKRILSHHPIAARPAIPAEDAMPLLDFLTLYILAGLWMLLALPQKSANRILEILFPVLR
jgi:hypothetical protein